MKLTVHFYAVCIIRAYVDVIAESVYGSMWSTRCLRMCLHSLRTWKEARKTLMMMLHLMWDALSY